ncbi:MAG: hypothetical protein AB7G23_15320 [Vicinamibacterales bacterium]
MRTDMGEMVLVAIRQASLNFLRTAAELVPRAVVTLSLILVGWIIAALLKRLTRLVLTRTGFGRLCERQGLAEALRNADLPPAETIVASLVFWVVWLGFLLSGVDVLGFSALQGLVQEFALFVPRLLVALVIVVVGMVVSNVAWRATLLGAVNARLPSPRVLAGAVRTLGLILTAAMALDQIAVARTIVLTAFAIAFGAVMFGLAIAFGIGGGGVARRILEHWFPERAVPPHDDLGHV